MVPLRERFNKKWVPEPNTGCWLWLGYHKNNGYGQFYVNNTPKYAHRVSYELYCRELQIGELVLHKCDTPACVNPAHLFVGSQADNIKDMHTKKRGYNSRKDKCHKGHFFDEGSISKDGRRQCRICRQDRYIREVKKDATNG